MDLLSESGEAVLYGSWDTGEAHLPSPVGGWIRSHSDVDVAHEEPLTPERKTALERRVEDLACRSRLSVARVSIRSAVLLANLPHLAAGTSTRSALPRIVYGDRASELVFWTHISALEALGTIRTALRRGLSGEGYAAAKLLLTLLRNLAMSQGEELRAHREIVRWCEARTTATAARKALQVKTGAVTLHAGEVAESFLSPECLGPLLGALCPRPAIRAVARVMAFCREHITGQSLVDCRDLLLSTRGLATDSVARAILDHQASKLAAMGFSLD